MYSHFEEDEITGRLLPNLTGTYVDIGAGDGITWSNTFQFLKRGWTGFAIEGDPEQWRRLMESYKDMPNCTVIHTRVSPENICELLHTVPDNFDLLSLDIDGYDLHVLRALLNTHRPKVICMEYNPHFPPGIKFSVKYSPDYWWGVDGFFGCSIEAAVETLSPFGYGIEAVIQDNVIFNLGTPNAGWEQKWEDGFLNRPFDMLAFYNHMARHLMAVTDLEERFAMAVKFFPLYPGKYDVWK